MLELSEYAKGMSDDCYSIVGAIVSDVSLSLDRMDNECLTFTLKFDNDTCACMSVLKLNSSIFDIEYLFDVNKWTNLKGSAVRVFLNASGAVCGILPLNRDSIIIYNEMAFKAYNNGVRDGSRYTLKLFKENE